VVAHVLRPERLRAMLGLAHERLTRLDDFVPYVSFFFGASLDYAPVLPQLRIKGRTHAQSAAVLRAFVDEIEKDTEARGFTAAGLEAFSRGFCERHGWKAKELFTLLRIAVTGRTAAPPLFDTMALVGKDRARMRLRDLVDLLHALPEPK
jgi:glutamyl-tRNA synthetase